MRRVNLAWITSRGLNILRPRKVRIVILGPCPPMQPLTGSTRCFWCLVIAFLTMWLACPAAVFGISRPYQLRGKVAGGGEVAIRVSIPVKGDRYEWVRYAWTFTHTSVHCSGEKREVGVVVHGAVEINADLYVGRDWGRHTVRTGSVNHPFIESSVYGRTTASGDARGRFSLRGSKVDLADGSTASCSARNLRWRATR